MNNRNLLERLVESPGAPGFEEPIRQLVEEQLDLLGLSHRRDRMGNVIATLAGAASSDLAAGTQAPSLLIEAHLDEIGFLVKAINENGFLRFHPLGGFDPKTLTSMRVLVHGKESIAGVIGSKPIHVMSTEERKKAPKISDFFIDIGLGAEQVKELVPIGSSVTRQGPLTQIGDFICAKSLDNRISVFLLLEALRTLTEQNITPAYPVHALFSVQEEVGLRGASVAAQALNAPYSLCLDTTIALDTPGAKPEERITAAGQGVAIKIMDSSVLCSQQMVSFLRSEAEQAGIDHQFEILTGGGTDTAGLQKIAGGSIAGALSLPTRYVHQSIEMIHEHDIDSCLELLLRAIGNIERLGA